MGLTGLRRRTKSSWTGPGALRGNQAILVAREHSKRACATLISEEIAPSVYSSLPPLTFHRDRKHRCRYYELARIPFRLLNRAGSLAQSANFWIVVSSALILNPRVPQSLSDILCLRGYAVQFGDSGVYAARLD